jgi:DNA-binding beta-propeller fold protein YncE
MKTLTQFVFSVFITLFISGNTWAFDSLVLVDRGYDQDLFTVTSDGQVYGVTNGVPWERASSVAVDDEGNFIVTVDIYSAYENSDGLYEVTQIGTVSTIAAGDLAEAHDLFTDPTGIAIDSRGNYIIVDQGWGPARIISVTPEGQATILYEGSPLLNPTGIAIDANGHYIITDRSTRGRYLGVSTFFDENGAVYRFNPTTQALTTICSDIDANGNANMSGILGHLAGIAIDDQGNFIITEPPAHLENGDMETPTGYAYLVIISPMGEILGHIHIPDLDNQIAMPYGIAIDDNGDYIVADGIGTTSQNGRILRVKPSGEASIIVESDQFSRPGGLALISHSSSDDGGNASDGEEDPGDDDVDSSEGDTDAGGGGGGGGCFIAAGVY